MSLDELLAALRTAIDQSEDELGLLDAVRELNLLRHAAHQRWLELGEPVEENRGPVMVTIVRKQTGGIYVTKGKINETGHRNKRPST